MATTPNGSTALTQTASRGSGSADSAVYGPRGRARRISDPRVAWAITAGAVALAPLVGVLLAMQPKLGIGLACAVAFAVLVLVRLTWGVGAMVPLLFVPYLSVANVLIKLGVLLIVAAWLAHVIATRRAEVEAALRRHRALLWSVGLFLGWMALSLVWADDTGKGLLEVWQWYPPVAMFLVIATTLQTRGEVTAICVLFAAGAVASMLAGVVGGGLTAAGELSASATPDRLQGASGDPNLLAAGLVAAIVVAGALIAVVRNHLGRAALLVAVAAMAVGLVASESRGGMIAAGVTALAAFALFKRQRLAVVCVLAIAASGLGLALATSPQQRERIFSADDGGSGRTVLWTVGWRLGVAHPVLGVGVNNFLVRSVEQARDPGSLEQVAIIQDPKVAVAHNTPLQAFADTGLIGFSLLMALVGAALATALRAARMFERLGETSLGTLARGVAVAQIAMFTAAFFLTMGRDHRWWVLFAIGPALLNLAHRLRDADARRWHPSTDAVRS